MIWSGTPMVVLPLDWVPFSKKIVKKINKIVLFPLYWVSFDLLCIIFLPPSLSLSFFLSHTLFVFHTLCFFSLSLSLSLFHSLSHTHTLSLSFTLSFSLTQVLLVTFTIVVRLFFSCEHPMCSTLSPTCRIRAYTSNTNTRILVILIRVY
jgi:hypothetical protein